MHYLIAEIGNNHEGNFQTALDLIGEAAACGVDAVKFQMFKADTLVHAALPARVGTGTQRERMRGLEFDIPQWRELEAYARDLQVDFFASVCDKSFLPLASNWPWIKIASGERGTGT